MFKTRRKKPPSPADVIMDLPGVLSEAEYLNVCRVANMFGCADYPASVTLTEELQNTLAIVLIAGLSVVKVTPK